MFPECPYKKEMVFSGDGFSCAEEIRSPEPKSFSDKTGCPIGRDGMKLLWASRVDTGYSRGIDIEFLNEEPLCMAGRDDDVAG
jgi:hypothetical protein